MGLSTTITRPVLTSRPAPAPAPPPPPAVTFVGVNPAYSLGDTVQIYSESTKIDVDVVIAKITKQDNGYYYNLNYPGTNNPRKENVPEDEIKVVKRRRPPTLTKTSTLPPPPSADSVS